MDGKDSIGAIVSSLEEVCGRLSRLRLAPGVDADTDRLIEAVIADPGGHYNLLSRLAARASSDREFREAFVSEARRVAGGSGDSGDSGDSSDGSGSDGAETDAEDKLSDEDVEDVFEEVGNIDGVDHTTRQDIRGRLRAGEPMPDWLAECVAEMRAAKEDDRRWWSDGEGEDEALEREDEREYEDCVRRVMLEDAQDALSDIEAEALAASPEDLLELLGLPAGAARKRPRLSVDEAPIEEVDAEFEAVEAALEDHERMAEQKEAAAAVFGDMLETFRALSGETKIPSEGARVVHDLERVLDQYSDDAGSVALDELLEARGRLRALLDAMTSGSSALKRKRAELEAIGEIRTEQSSTAPAIGRAAFGRLAREIGQDFSDLIRFDDAAIDALQAAAEDYLVGLFGHAGRAAIHAGRTHITPGDLQFICSIRGERV